MTPKPEQPVKDTCDWKLATVRQNCLAEACKIWNSYDDGGRTKTVIELAEDMYKFVIGEEKTND